MATTSIFKSVKLRTSQQCASITRALEQSAKHSEHYAPIPYQHSCSNMSREEMRRIFANDDDGLQNRKTK